MKKEQYILLGIIGIILYLLSTGVSYGVFRIVGKNTTTHEVTSIPSLTTPSNKPQRHFTVDPSIPRTEICPINGEKYTKEEKAIWEKRRPLAVMIENHEDSRPQSGLSFADVVYEAVAEGGITRFMGVFYCGIGQNVRLAPVRSARTYYLPWVLEYDALYNHVGGAGKCNDDTVDERAKALCQIDQYQIKDMDQFGLPFKYPDASGKKISVCYRNPDRLDHPVSTEHTMVCETQGLYTFAAEEKNWTNVDAKGVSWDKKFQSWKFKDEAKESERGAATSISFVAWKGYEKQYGVKWEYDKTMNAYKRSNGGMPHKDLEIDEQLTAKAIVVMFAKETGPVDDHMHMLYGTIGSGDGYLFQDGETKKITWSKLDKSARTVFSDAQGKEVVLNRGQIWIEVLPIGTQISY